MYVNGVLTRLEITEKDAGMGYIEREYTSSGETYPVDLQPYSKELAKKDYGLSEEGVVYRCFTEKRGLVLGDYVSSGDIPYHVLFVHDWENHSEIILGLIKDG